MDRVYYTVQLLSIHSTVLYLETGTPCGMTVNFAMVPTSTLKTIHYLCCNLQLSRFSCLLLDCIHWKTHFPGIICANRQFSRSPKSHPRYSITETWLSVQKCRKPFQDETTWMSVELLTVYTLYDCYIAGFLSAEVLQTCDSSTDCWVMVWAKFATWAHQQTECCSQLWVNLKPILTGRSLLSYITQRREFQSCASCIVILANQLVRKYVCRENANKELQSSQQYSPYSAWSY